jgi:hypothetical protein
VKGQKGSFPRCDDRPGAPLQCLSIVNTLTIVSSEPCAAEGFLNYPSRRLYQIHLTSTAFERQYLVICFLNPSMSRPGIAHSGRVGTLYERVWRVPSRKSFQYWRSNEGRIMMHGTCLQFGGRHREFTRFAIFDLISQHASLGVDGKYERHREPANS